MKLIAAMVLNDKGDLLPYTCQSTMEQCEEEAPKILLGWDAMKMLGAKVVQVEITTLEEVVDPRLKDWPASTEASMKKAYRGGWENGYLPYTEKSDPNPFPKGTDEDKEWERGYTNGRQDAHDSWGD
jgi:hypothetical protein